jgi:hypothetical protein
MIEVVAHNPNVSRIIGCFKAFICAPIIIAKNNVQFFVSLERPAGYEIPVWL